MYYGISQGFDWFCDNYRNQSIDNATELDYYIFISVTTRAQPTWDAGLIGNEELS